MIRTIFAFLALALTAVQAYLIYTRGSGICFNDGCDIVEKLTTVPALYFNLLGALFFGLVFLGSLITRITYSENMERYTNLLLTAALAAEAVLLFFQWSVAQTFCSYCLIIFSFVLVLNLLGGWQQIVSGLPVFCAVLIASFSLQFDAAGAGKSLSFGTVAQYTREGNSRDLLLIFSKTCPHCEKVIDFLREGTTCNVAFNPIEKLESFNFAGAEVKKSHDPRATIGFMRSVGMSGIPILIAPDGEGEGMSVLNGTDQILPYLRKYCKNAAVPSETEEDGISSVGGGATKFQLPASSTKKDDVCSSGDDC